MQLKTIVLSLILWLTFALTVCAQLQEISTDRPDQSNTPLLVPKGALQIETGFLAEKENSGAINTSNYTYNNTLLRFGINENFELRFNTIYQGSINSSDIISRRGFGPVSVGMKIKLADKNGIWPQASIITHINLRSGSKEFKPSYLSNDITLASCHDIGERFSITYNVGVAWNGESPEGIALYALSLGCNLTNKLGLFAESYAYFQRNSKPDHRVDAGITYKISPLIQYDLSGGIGLTTETDSHFFSTGLSIRLFN